MDSWDRKRTCLECLKPFLNREFRIIGTHKYRVRCTKCQSRFVEQQNHQIRMRIKRKAEQQLAIRELEHRIAVAKKLKREHGGILLTREILASAGL